MKHLANLLYIRMLPLNMIGTSNRRRIYFSRNFGTLLTTKGVLPVTMGIP